MDRQPGLSDQLHRDLCQISLNLQLRRLRLSFIFYAL